MSVLSHKSKEINGRKYTVSMFPAGTGFQIMFELKNALGPAVGSLIGDKAEMVLTMLGGDLSKEGALDLILRLLELTTVEGTGEGLGVEDAFNNHFAGRYGELLKVLAFVVEVNFADFFAEIKSVIGAGMKTVEKTLGLKLKSQSASALSGQSTESLLKKAMTSQE